MTERRELFQTYPVLVEAGSSRSTLSYRREELYFAVQGKSVAESALTVEWKLSDEDITVFKGELRDLDTEVGPERLRPVYRLLPDGPVVVPTGLVFARFADNVDAEDRRADLSRAGYDIESVPAYARQCAWLKPLDGRISSGLLGIAALRAIADMVSVEPQMLSPRMAR